MSAPPAKSAPTARAQGSALEAHAGREANDCTILAPFDGEGRVQPDMESSKKTVDRVGAKRRKLRVRIGVVVVAVVALGAAFLVTRSADSEEAGGTTPGFSEDDRPIDTSPFELAGPNVTGATTIPGDLGQAGEPTIPPNTLPPATTSTTIPIPGVADDDPVCTMARSVIEGLRIVTGPSGTSPANLRAGAEKFREAADIALNSGRPGTAPVALLVAQIAVDLPGARNEAEAEAIYTRLTAPTDPLIQPVAAEFGAHLQEFCPELLTVEP